MSSFELCVDWEISCGVGVGCPSDVGVGVEEPCSVGVGCLCGVNDSC